MIYFDVLNKKILINILIISGLIFLSASTQIKNNTIQSLTELIPNFTPKNLKLHDQVKEFTPANLYEPINGRAEFFIAYDIVDMTLATFTKNDLNGSFIKLYVYDMGNPTNAFGVFSSEKCQETLNLQLGRTAYCQDASYYIWKGQYYITVISSENSEELNTIGKIMAEKVCNALKDSGEKVWGLSAMPAKDLISGTINYVKSDAMVLV